MIKTERVIKLFASHLLGQAIVIASVFIVPSMLLRFWSSETYGLWVLACGAAIFFSYADFGVSVALNSAMHTVGQKSRGAAVVLFFSGLKLIKVRIICCTCILALMMVFLLVFKIYSNDFLIALFFCGMTFVLQPLVNTMLAVYRWREEPWKGVFFDQIFRIIELFFIVSIFGYIGPLWASFVLFVLKLLYAGVILWFNSGLYSVGKKYSINSLFKSQISLSVNGFGGLLSFFGASLSVQGFMLLAGLLGTHSAAVFASLRTISRVHLQPVSVINSTASPIFNIYFSKGRIVDVRNNSIKIAVLTFFLWGLAFWVALHFVGDIQRYWLHDKFIIDPGLLKWMFFAAGVNSANQFSVMLMQSANQYMAGGISQMCFVLAGLAVGGVLLFDYGLYGLAYAWLGSELLSFVYIFSRILIVLKS